MFNYTILVFIKNIITFQYFIPLYCHTTINIADTHDGLFKIKSTC